MNRYFFLGILFVVFACKSPEARRPISVKTGSFIDKSVIRNIELNEQEHIQISKFIEKQDSIVSYLQSDSGFWYGYNTKIETDSLPTPKFGDIVSYNYNVKHFNGSEIYSSEDIKTQTYAIDQEELFTGLREGLKLMKAGETITFLFPSQKAYGYYGDENKIGRNTPLICQVTLNSITSNKTE
ncbi:MAG: gliding motility-associated peptidyl-prolyl isomerase GldI [Aestuariibaculum sp.]